MSKEFNTFLYLRKLNEKQFDQKLDITLMKINNLNVNFIVNIFFALLYKYQYLINMNLFKRKYIYKSKQSTITPKNTKCQTL